MQTLSNNLTSLFSQRKLATAQTQLSQSVERLSSSLRINRAKDDAAGLGISQELQRQTRSVAVATRNANDAISMVQTAEGALQSVSDMLLRLKELTTQGANESLSKDQRKFIASEISQLRKEINAVAERTTFNKTKLLTGDFSEAVRGEFSANLDVIQSEIDQISNESTLKIGDSSNNRLSGASAIQLTRMTKSGAPEGQYSLSNAGSTVTLRRVYEGIETFQSIKLVATDPQNSNEVKAPTALNESFSLSFDELGVELEYKVTTLGSRKTAYDFASLIPTISQTPSMTGWQKVLGADWASGTGTVMAKILSTDGNLKISTTSGLSPVDGFNPPITWTTGNTNQLVFTGSVTDINAALKTLEVNAVDGRGQVTIEFAEQFPNAGFSNNNVSRVGTTNTYSAEGWLITRERVILGTTKIEGWTTPTDPTQTAVSGRTTKAYSDANLNSGSYTFDFSSTELPPGTSGFSLQLENSLSQTNDGSYGNSIHGPYIVSKTAVDITAGDSVSFKWQAKGGSDAYDAFAYILNTNTGEAQIILNETGPSASAETDWAEAEIAVQKTGSYKFVFIGGSWDASGGGALGGSLYIDDVQVTSAAPKEGTIKTINIGGPATFVFDDPIQVSAVTTNSADIGTYRISANTEAKILTLTHYDPYSNVLLGSETIALKEPLVAGDTKDYSFERLGVVISLNNRSQNNLILGSPESGLIGEIKVASSRMASLIGSDGPKFQTGEASRNDFAVSAFRDMRLGKNTDGEYGALFNEVNDLILSLANSNDPATSAFQRLENKVEDMIDVVTTRRSDFGVIQNRLSAAINNVNEQYSNLTAAKSQIEDTDFAWETARLTKLQIGQQASTAMLAQANAIPNVILALLE